MTIYFTSDPHFGHSKVIEYCNCPFANADEMDEALITNWNRRVSPHDTVFLLGDVFFHNADRAKVIVKRLNGTINVVMGNHDKVLRNNADLRNMFNRICPPLHEEKIDDINVVMCHYPLLTWNKAHHGSYMLYGHAHGNIAFDPNFRRLDVGVDNHNYAPISWDEIKAKLSVCNSTDVRDRY